MWYQCSDLDLQIFSCLVNERLWWRCCQWCRCNWCVLLLTIIVYLCSPFVSYLWDFPQVCVTLSVSGTSSTYIFTLEPHEHLHSIVCKKKYQSICIILQVLQNWLWVSLHDTSLVISTVCTIKNICRGYVIQLYQT